MAGNQLGFIDDYVKGLDAELKLDQKVRQLSPLIYQNMTDLDFLDEGPTGRTETCAYSPSRQAPGMFVYTFAHALWGQNCDKEIMDAYTFLCTGISVASGAGYSITVGLVFSGVRGQLVRYSSLFFNGCSLNKKTKNRTFFFNRS
jgi:hypothetical protein